MWTHFWDMSSGGGSKEKWDHIYIEAPEEEARRVFYAKFGHNPDRVSCTCCGADYSTSEGEDLAQLTGYHRNCQWEGDKYTEGGPGQYGRAYQTLETYKKGQNVLFISREDILPEWRTVEVPEQGYVWRD